MLWDLYRFTQSLLLESCPDFQEKSFPQEYPILIVTGSSNPYRSSSAFAVPAAPSTVLKNHGCHQCHHHFLFHTVNLLVFVFDAFIYRQVSPVSMCMILLLVHFITSSAPGTHSVTFPCRHGTSAKRNVKTDNLLFSRWSGLFPRYTREAVWTVPFVFSG